MTTPYQDMWLEFQIETLPHLFVDVPQGYRHGQHLFNSLPGPLAAKLLGTPLDTFNWTDHRFLCEFPTWISRVDALAAHLDREN